VLRVKKLSHFLIFLIFASCANQQYTNNENVKELSNSNKVSRVQQHLVDKNLPNCVDCILGSIGDEDLRASSRKVYVLEGADELNLRNIRFDIPVTYNKATKKWIKYFTTRGRGHFRRYAERAGRYAPVLSKILNDQGMPRDLIYLSMAESGFQNAARSWAKAVGPWQFMPYTGKSFGLEVGFYLDERRDPLKATIAASKYLRRLHSMFNSWELAMAGYNAGEGKIKRAIKRYRTNDFWKLRRGRYLKPETKNYVPKIMALAIIGKNLSRFGFEDVEFHHALDFEEINVPQNTDLYKVAEVLGLDFKKVKKYNPELLRWQTPPHGSNYVLRVPVGIKKNWDNYTMKNSVIASDYKVYQLRGHASLYNVGRKFKVPTKVLSELNNTPSRKSLAPKTVVLLPFRNDHKHKENRLYADLYEKPRKSVQRRRKYQRWIKRGVKKGQRIANPSQFYVVKKGDTLWAIARTTGVNINTIIKSNHKLVKRRMILPGDKLAIR
jgi:membrane-bound lytic murein transglycosylase D